MVKVTIYEDNGRIKSFKITGHANFGPKGEDLVCSAVSALTQSAIIALCQYVNLDAGGKVESGFIDFILPDEMDEKQQIQADAILTTMAIGLNELKISFNKHIRLEKRRWNP